MNPAPNPPARFLAVPFFSGGGGGVVGRCVGSGVTGSLQVSRCLTLLSQDEGAATAFYSRLHEHTGVPSAAKMFAMLLRCAVVAARTTDDGDGNDDGGGGGGAREEKGKGGVHKKGKRKGVDEEEVGSGGGSGKGDRILRASDSKVWWLCNIVVLFVDVAVYA